MTTHFASVHDAAAHCSASRHVTERHITTSLTAPLGGIAQHRTTQSRHITSLHDSAPRHLASLSVSTPHATAQQGSASDRLRPSHGPALHSSTPEQDTSPRTTSLRPRTRRHATTRQPDSSHLTTLQFIARRHVKPPPSLVATSHFSAPHHVTAPQYTTPQNSASHHDRPHCGTFHDSASQQNIPLHVTARRRSVATPGYAHHQTVLTVLGLTLESSTAIRRCVEPAPDGRTPSTSSNRPAPAALGSAAFSDIAPSARPAWQSAARVPTHLGSVRSSSAGHQRFAVVALSLAVSRWSIRSKW